MSAKSVTGSIGWCHICGLRIPCDIASPDHPLYGTVDHVIPKSMGGREAVSNRRAAHRTCNHKKANCWPIDEIFRLSMQSSVRKLLEKTGHTVTDKNIRTACSRISVSVPSRTHSIPYVDQIGRWEGEGGACSPE